MIKVNVEVEHKPWLKRFKSPKKIFIKNLKKISKIIPSFKKKNLIFTILLTNSKKMRKLNKKFRKKNKSTDVLSFPFFSKSNMKLIKEKNIYIGDIAICYEIICTRSNSASFLFEFNLPLPVKSVFVQLGYLSIIF